MVVVMVVMKVVLIVKVIVEVKVMMIVKVMVNPNLLVQLPSTRGKAISSAVTVTPSLKLQATHTAE